MKYVIILLASFLMQPSSAFAQHNKGSAFLSPRIGYLNIDGFNPQPYIGIELDYMVSDKVGIHYSLLFGQKYFHMPLAPIGGAFIGIAIAKAASESDTTRSGMGIGLFVGLLTAIIPEGISYTTRVSSKLYIAPYVSPLQFEVLNKEAFAGGAIGLRFHRYFHSEKIRLSPYFEIKKYYGTTPHLGFSTGASLSFAIK